MMSMLVLFLAIYLFFACLPLFIPSLRSLVVICAVLVGLYVLAYYSREIGPKGYNSRHWYTAVFVWAILICTVPGVITRAITLPLKHVGCGVNVRIAVSVIGIGALPTLVMSIVAYHWMEQQPPSSACLERKHPFVVGDTLYQIPTSPAFSIESSKSQGRRRFWFASHRQIRHVCKETHDGVHPIDADKITIQLNSTYSICKANSRKFELLEEFCAHRRGAKNTMYFAPDIFPDEISISSENYGANLSSRPSKSTYDDSLKLGATYPGRSYYVTHPNVITPEGKPLTVFCRQQRKNHAHCESAFAFVNGSTVVIAYSKKVGDVKSHQVAAYHWTMEVLEKLREPAESAPPP